MTAKRKPAILNIQLTIYAGPDACSEKSPFARHDKQGFGIYGNAAQPRIEIAILASGSATASDKSAYNAIPRA